MRIALVAACGATLLAGAAPAGAATLVADKACYVAESADGAHRRRLRARARRSTSRASRSRCRATPGPDGAFSATVRAPLLGTIKPAAKRFTVTADRPDDEHRGVRRRQRRATRSSRHVDGLQEPEGQAHVEVQRALPESRQADLRALPPRREDVRQLPLRRARRGPCGTLTRKAPGIPGSSVPSGRWTVQIDFERSYDPNAAAAPDRQHDGLQDVRAAADQSTGR